MVLLARSVARLARPACAVCALAPGPVCPECESDFFPTRRARCAVCALPMASVGTVCGRCLAEPPHFVRTTALADYAPPVDGMVTALKFGGRLDLAKVFGRLLAERVMAPPDALVAPIPLAFERLSERGFNQALQIARAYCRASQAPLAADLLLRVRHAPPQHSLALGARRRNVRGAFAVSGDAAGRTVLVVDDVLTSGSTMDEAARVLRAAGAVAVHALVVARTP